MARAPAPTFQNPDRSNVGTAGPPPEAVIRSEVLAALGLPPSLIRLVVVRLWAGYYRVNVLTGSDVLSVRVAHSYFVRTTEAGSIMTATPPVVRLYP